VFNGRRFRTEIVPRIVEFIRASETAEPISSGGKPSSAEPPRTFMARLAAGRQLAAKAG
jgi:hypothetical protein